MQIYSGRLVIDLATIVESDEEEIAVQKAHDGLTTELFREIKIILGANGYMVGQMGATLQHVVEPKRSDFELIKLSLDEAKEQANQVYNKANINRFTIE